MVATRFRKSDLLIALGLVLLLTWLPGYTAQSEAETALADGVVFSVDAPREGMRFTQELIVQVAGQDPIRVEDLYSYHYRRAAADEIPVASHWVEERVRRGGTFELGIGTLRMVPEERRTYYDAAGRVVWSEADLVLEMAAEDGTTNVTDTTRSYRVAQLGTELHEIHGTTLRYDPSTFRGMAQSSVHGITSEFFDKDGPPTFVLGQAVTHQGRTLYGDRDGMFRPLDRLFDGPHLAGMDEDTRRPTWHLWDDMMMGNSNLRIELYEVLPGAEDGFGWSWYMDGVPMAAGSHDELRDSEGNLLASVDLLPSAYEAGSGPTFPLHHVRQATWRSFMATAEPGEPVVPMIPLRDIETRDEPFVHGVSIVDLKQAMQDPDAPEWVRTLIRDGGAVREFLFWTESATTSAGPAAEGLDAITGLVDAPAPRTHHLSHWLLTVVDADDMAHIIRIDLDQTVPGDLDTATISFADPCHVEDAAMPARVQCATVDPGRYAPDRLVADPWVLLADAERQIADSRAAGSDVGETVDRFAFVPGYHAFKVQQGPNAWGGGIGYRLAPSTGQFSNNFWSSQPDPALPADGIAYWLADNDDADGPRLIQTYDLQDGTILTEQAVRSSGPSDAPPSQRPTQATSTELVPVRLDPVATTTAVGGLLLVLIGAFPRLLVWFKAGGHFPVVAVLYAKIAKDDVLQNQRREEILGLLEADPGLTPSEVAERLTLGWGVTVHHLQTLRKNGYLVDIREGRRRHYFPAGSGGAEARLHAIVDRTPEYREFYRVVHARPGITLKELDEEIARGRTGLSRTGSRLADLGLVVKRRDGMTVRFYPKDAAQAA